MAPAGIFISYSRRDQDFVRALGERLVAEGFTLWRDRVDMEGGKDWWLQIQQAIQGASDMILVMSPHSLASEVVRKEWRYARQVGRRVIPVLASAVDFDTVPRWMSKVDWIDHALIANPAEQALVWERFINQLKTPYELTRVPFMAGDLPRDFVPRPEEFEAILAPLLDTSRENPVAITTAIQGMGGYGKTTLASAICHDDRILDAYQDGVLWVTLGESFGDPLSKLLDFIEMLTDQRPTLTNVEAARARLREVLTDRDVLLVVDDVWKREHLRPFLEVNPDGSVLVTTRNINSLPPDMQRVHVGRMKPDEALALLTAGLPDETVAAAHDALAQLAHQRGDWALLLELTNRVLRERVVNRGQDLDGVLTYIHKRIGKRGLTSFDEEDAADRRDAVKLTIGLSLDLLKPDERLRYQELCIFPDDVNIPLVTAERLWGATADFDDTDTEELVERLYQLSLLLAFDVNARTLRFHDVLRQYLREQATPAEVQAWNGQFLATYSVPRWADLPPDEPYLWRHLGTHLIAAGRDQEFVALMHNARYLAAKTLAVGPQFVEEDFSLVLRHTPNRQHLTALMDTYVNMAHLLVQCSTLNDALATMHSRIQHVDDQFDMRQYIEKEIQHPYIEALHPLPDLPPYSLTRTLVQGRFLTCCAWSPDGTKVVAGGWESRLLVWNLQTLKSEFECRHDRYVNDCAWSPDGTRLLSASDDATVRLWDATQGDLIAALEGHTERITICAWIMDGNSFVTASDDGTLRIWDTQSTEVRHVLEQGAPITALSCDDSVGKLYVASADGNLTVWSMESGTMMEQAHLENVVSVLAASDRGGLMLIGMGLEDTPAPKSVVLICRLSNLEFVVSHLIDGWVSSGGWSYDGRFAAVASTSGDVYVLDHLTGLIHPYKDHSQAVNDCEWSPKRHKVLTVSNDGTLKIWRASIDVFKHIQQASASRTWTISCDFSPNGTQLATYNLYNQATLWDVATGEFTQIGDVAHGQPRSILWSPDGKKILVASGGTVFVYDSATNKCIHQIEFQLDITSCTWSTDTSKILLGFQTGRVGLLESSSLSIVWDRDINNQYVTGFSWNPTHDGFVVSKRSLVCVMDTTFNTLHVLHENTHIEDAYWTKTCSWSPDGSYILAVFDNGQICIWGTGDYALLATIEANAVYAAWSPTAKQILAVSDNGAIQIWDIAKQAIVASLFVSSHLKCCAWSPDGTTLAAGGDGGLYFLRWVP